ncbi:hypothetical protein XBJ2_160020 [Xenorhabdus bovienii str. Jollieti]|uniref:Uncharacterized protein n=1 Tax=Xenorhabdus bovienii (strain SS-2004) TaxID=406818 RepID=D3UZ67_XENBS|nr:hypothetical protein [Xenorhabdus bovienii]CBJ79649.1 hypothetical protein XBJ1_0500 [Xenorhabdus bovienii SS-2004]CDH28020.1 hypothetical protein XBJ2_160020 [Xenorhabdus bovienii str. Jollieti]
MAGEKIISPISPEPIHEWIVLPTQHIDDLIKKAHRNSLLVDDLLV